MPVSWITLYPQWYIEERQRLQRHYPQFRIDESALAKGVLCSYGELKVMPPGGTVRHPVALRYPEGTPFMVPVVVLLTSLPEIAGDGTLKKPPDIKMFDHRHQMPGGMLCLFQREARAL